jgi:hypothetical protein
MRLAPLRPALRGAPLQLVCAATSWAHRDLANLFELRLVCRG